MKHAILILAHKNFEQLERLVSYFEGQCDIIIHIDKKSNISEEEENKLREYPGVISVFRKYRIKWAGFNILRAELFLLRESLVRTRAQTFHLLSGQDYPIKPLVDFLSFFEENKDKSFLDCTHLPAPHWDEHTYWRVKYYFFPDWIDYRSSKGRETMLKIVNWQKKLRIKRKIPDQMEHLYGGSAWFSITRDSAEYLINYTKKKAAFYHRMKFTYVPEEIYVSTVLMNSDLKPNIIANNNCRYIFWNEAGACSPMNFTEDRFYDLSTSAAFFARKFDVPDSSKILQLIDENLLHNELFKCTHTGAWQHNTFTGYSFDSRFKDALIHLCKIWKVKTVVDLGCGPGWYVTALRRAQIATLGYDGNPYTTSLSTLMLNEKTKYPCEQVDLTEDLKCEEPYDLVLCLSVGEYIPIQYEEQVISNLINSTSRYLLISWTTPDHRTPEMVNCHTVDYIKREIIQRGFIEDELATHALRTNCFQPSFKDSILAFQKSPSK